MFEYKCMHLFLKSKCIFKYKYMHINARGYGTDLMGLRPLEIFFLLQCGDRLSDIYRRQILTTKVDPCAVRVKFVFD